MLIGILQTGHVSSKTAERVGTYPELFEKLLGDQGFEFRTYSVVDMEFPASITECEGWLLTGSRHGAYEDHPFIKPLEEFIRASYAASIPLVGVCFGHQIIAQALGGKVEKFKGGWSVGRQEYEFEGQKLQLNAWHQDQVVERPPEAETIGCSDFCENAALLYGDRAFTIQAHPEFDHDFMAELIEMYRDGPIPAEQIDAAESQMGTDLDRGHLARRIGSFLLQPRERNQEGRDG